LIPEVDDDGDEQWEDVSNTYKMVIVINVGLKMGAGKIASQVNKYNLTFVFPKIELNNNGLLFFSKYYWP